MKRLGGVWQQLVSFENLLLAYKKARRGKSRRAIGGQFECNLEKGAIAIAAGTAKRGISAWRLSLVYHLRTQTPANISRAVS